MVQFLQAVLWVSPATSCGWLSNAQMSSLLRLLEEEHPLFSGFEPEKIRLWQGRQPSYHFMEPELEAHQVEGKT